MIRLQPEWVGDLMGLWASQDLAEDRERLGYPSECKMFSRCIQVSVETEDVTGFSSSELKAMAVSMERLQREFPSEWMALSAEYRPWLKQPRGEPELIAQAGKRIQAWVDEIMGD